MIKPEEAEKWLELIFSFGGWGMFLFVIYYILFFPEKAEKVSSLFWKLVSKFWKFGEKRFITHDIQGRINDYVNNYLSKEITNFTKSNIKLEWVDENQTEENFRKNGKLIVRMRKSENQNKNFVNASMVFISENLLNKAKVYISKKQRESVDLYVGRKLFETEKEEVLVQFVTDFFQKGNSDKKIGDFLEKYERIDQTGLFFPVFIQEMTFLGEKVFASTFSKKNVFEEVNGLINFLNKYSERKLGEENETTFNGKYSKFGIMIVGKSWKVSGIGSKPYKKHIQALIKKGVETIYLIGNQKKQNFIKDICEKDFLEDCNLFLFNNRIYFAKIKNKKNEEYKVETYLTVLRSNKVSHYFMKDK